MWVNAIKIIARSDTIRRFAFITARKIVTAVRWATALILVGAAADEGAEIVASFVSWFDKANFDKEERRLFSMMRGFATDFEGSLNAIASEYGLRGRPELAFMLCVAKSHEVMEMAGGEIHEVAKMVK